jgi:hypothetical protein
MVPPIRRGRGWLWKVQLQECPRYRVFVIRAIHGVIHFLLFFANGTAYHQLTCKNLIGHNFATSADHPVSRPKVNTTKVHRRLSSLVVPFGTIVQVHLHPVKSGGNQSTFFQDCATDVNYHFYKWF